MKILITTDLYTVSTNGVVTSVQNLFDELTANGHDVRILTISGDLHSHKEGAVYYIRSVPLKGVYPDLRMPTSFRHKLIQEIIDWKPDVVHSQCEFFSFQFAKRISKLLREKGIITEQVNEEVYGAEKSKLFPTDIGTVVNDYLVENFKSIIDYNFTAQVEKDLDKIAEGQEKWESIIDDFYQDFHKQYLFYK